MSRAHRVVARILSCRGRRHRVVILVIELAVLLAVMAVMAVAALAELPELPDAPSSAVAAKSAVTNGQHTVPAPAASSRRIPIPMRALYLADLGLRIADIVTTHRDLNNPCECMREADPIAPHGKGWAGDVAFQAGMWAAVTVGAEVLRRHRHGRLAAAGVAGDVASETWAVQHNLRLPVTGAAAVVAVRSGGNRTPVSSVGFGGFR